MKTLTFQAKRFWWKSFAKTLEAASDDIVEDEVCEAVVAFLHIEQRDEGDERQRVFLQTLKHLKWIANKRAMRCVALHSFTHLGGTNATPAFADQFLRDLAERLRATGYTVKVTPFGWFCEWSLDVYGESMAKVYKEVGPTSTTGDP